ncbi:hypothetical protein L208DRAFT_1341638 [Tricholoma matsutake]|nr:hypothetical protein L208DRAFT_1341638 [Tricholoma matsutake 945]
MKKLQDSSAPVTGWDFPTFFYPNNSFDPDNWDSGLLCSPLLLCVFKHIFMLPSSVTHDEPGLPGRMKTKGSQAKLNGMDSVSATSITYAALQLCWCLSCSEDWQLDDGNFDHEKFYSMIAVLFNDNDADDTSESREVSWAEDTMRWWNE